MIIIIIIIIYRNEGYEPFEPLFGQNTVFFIIINYYNYEIYIINIYGSLCVP